MHSSCITALSHVIHGLVILPTAIQLCSDLARLAIQLDQRPDLTRRLRQVASVDQSEGRKTLVQATAESIQRAFTICLTERSSNRDGVKDGKPEGKKIGIYSFANMVLKLFFQVRRGKENSLSIVLISNLVPENGTCESTLHQHITEFPAIGALSCEPTSYISLLSWPLSLLQ